MHQDAGHTTCTYTNVKTASCVSCRDGTKGLSQDTYGGPTLRKNTFRRGRTQMGGQRCARIHIGGPATNGWPTLSKNRFGRAGHKWRANAAQEYIQEGRPQMEGQHCARIHSGGLATNGGPTLQKNTFRRAGRQEMGENIYVRKYRTNKLFRKRL